MQGKDRNVVLDNILIGDVWLLGGQSNMEFELHKVEEGPLEIISANFDQIRLFTVPQQNGPEVAKAFPKQYQWSDFFSQHFRQGYWDVCSPETVRDMSGIGYVFGRRIHMATRIPIGIVGIITQETQDQPQTLENFLPPMVDEGVYIREVHYQTYLKLRDQGDKNIGYASSFDQHRAWYHPQIKVPVGERIAKWALATQYGKPIRWLPPQLQECKIEAGRMILKLDTWAIPFHDGPIQGFAIAGKDGRFQPAKAVWFDKNEGKGEPNWERSMIVLSSELVPEPVYFRYAWARNPLENLKSSDNAGLPFDTQRNDSFSLADMYEIYTGKKTVSPGVISPSESRELVQSLQTEDKKRRIFEARKLLDEKFGSSSR